MSMKILGRYDVISELGRGSFGIMYLATDTRMSRQVVIQKIGPVSIAQSDGILQEARSASTLHHHLIVPVYDLGVAEGAIYIVYMQVAGESLTKFLKRSEVMTASSAIGIMTDVLDALASAHGQGVLHLDLNPASVTVSTAGQHYVSDFGIARSVSKIQKTIDEARLKSIYMAPEIAEEEGGELRSDIFSAGVMLYEMLNGSVPKNIENLHKSASNNDKVDQKLMRIVLKATALLPNNRYSSALDMRQDLTDYLESLKAVTVSAADADVASTLKFLLRRIRSKSDFPAISGVIHEINKIVASDTDDTSKLAQIILQDFSLTNKLLKLVNTASYAQYGGKISTVSKAVSILGFETVRNIATTLIVMDFMKNKAQSEELKDVVVSSFFSGIVAVKLSEWKTVQEVEEAMICSMFFNLGRMLSKFYFFDESEEIARLVEKNNVSEGQAAIEVLGISYNELGLGIAKSWNFPESLISGMQRITNNSDLKPEDNIGRLNVAVNMANDLCSIASVNDPVAKKEALAKVKARYSAVTDASDEKLVAALTNSLQELSQRSKVLGIDSSKSATVDAMKQLVSDTVESVNKRAKVSSDNSAIAGAATGKISSAETELAHGDSEEKMSVETFLSDGLQDVVNTMSGDYKLNDVLQMVLETIFRGLGFKHVMIMSRDNKNNKMVARFGFGEKIVDILPIFHFPLTFEADVFHLAMSKGLDIVIEDVAAPNIASKIPAWFAKAVDSGYFLLLPMVLNNHAIGMIYADMQEAKKLKISPSEMAILRKLRDQASQAIKQKSQA